VTVERLLAAALLATALGVLPAAPAGPTAEGPIVVAQVKAGGEEPEALADGALRADGGEGGRLVLVEPGGKVRVLTKAFHSAADPEVSFDGRSILFAGKKTARDPWCVYEMSLAGTGARKVTCGKAGARQPVYQSTVYTITPTSVEPWQQVAFVGQNPGELNEAGVAANTSLWSCKLDGTALRRLTYNLSNDRDPTVLPDGRMVYAGLLRSPEADRRERVALLGVNEDGTDYQLYAGPEGLRVKQMPAPTAGGLLVFVEADRIAGDGGGRLAAVSQARPLHSHRALTASDDGLFRSPAPLPDGRILVARRSPGGGPWSIWRFDPRSGAREKLFAEPAWHSVEARLVGPRPVPDARSSVVNENDAQGRIYTIDVGIQEAGRSVPPGSVKRVRVVEGVAATAERPARLRLLGEADVAQDGSCQVQVPANTPLRLQLLDARGQALRSSAWIWVRSHAAQGCVGCHEDPERTPPNRMIEALRSPAPVLDPPPDSRAWLDEESGGRP
jgi:Tol biopolymer transport system component